MRSSLKRKRISIRIVTPVDARQRGSQLSVRIIGGVADSILAGLEMKGVAYNLGRPDVIRIAPVPLCNTFEEVVIFSHVLRGILQRLNWRPLR